MKNSNAYARSNTGIVIYAFNTDAVDYVKIADRSASVARKTLNLPVTLITDKTANPEFDYDSVKLIDTPVDTYRLNSELKETVWRNRGRSTVYHHSPYDTTILIDSDYLILDDSLTKLLDLDMDYLVYDRVDSDTGIDRFMGATSIPFIWATVCVFRKTSLAEQFFDLVGRIERNYNYYRLLYNIREGNYRNDYAFTIADNVLNGYSKDKRRYIPWPMNLITKNISSVAVGSFVI